MTDTSKEAVDATKASHKTLTSEYMFGIQVAAYDEDIETSFGPVKRYCSHWSTPGKGAVNVRRLFAEEDVLSLLSDRDALRAQLQAARDDNDAMRKAVDGTLSERMVAAGMVPLDAMTQPNCLTKFSVHSGMTDLKFFEEWVERKAKSYGRMQAAHQTGEHPLDPKIFDFVVGKSGAFKEVLENYRAALKSTSAEGEG